MSTRPETSFHNDMEAQVHALLINNDTKKLRAFLAKQHPADIADVMDRLNDMQRDTLFALLSTETKAEVLDEMSITATRHVLDRLPPEEIGKLLDRMPMDEAAELISEDVPDRQDEILALMSPKRVAEVRKLFNTRLKARVI